MPNAIREQILEKSKEYGACLAGIARVEDLEKSLSYQKFVQVNHYNDPTIPERPETAQSILVFAVMHPRSEPKLDWWDKTPGSTPGNRILMEIQLKMMTYIKEEWGLSPQSLPYGLNEGGIFLKDSAALAGLGIIGKNNLLITPEFGPQVRLRAIFLDIDLDPTGPTGFDPCTKCNMPCFKACPQDAFRSGSYEYKYCKQEMLKNESDQEPHPDNPEINVVRYCRRCEFSCPVSNNL